MEMLYKNLRIAQGGHEGRVLHNPRIVLGGGRLTDAAHGAGH